jgi:hypothetical protein
MIMIFMKLQIHSILSGGGIVSNLTSPSFPMDSLDRVNLKSDYVWCVYIRK